MKFYLGTHRPTWLSVLDVPLFVSRRVMPKRKLPVARAGWALDSGGFTELKLFGEWRTTPTEYVNDVRRYRDEVGNLEWASPQDWMCEPWMVAKTGLTIEEHQRRTIANYLTLRDLDASLPFVPVLQGWEFDDYRRHVDAYTAAGVDLTAERTVGVGSVCRRQHTAQIGEIVNALAADGLRLHGFGVKTQGLRSYAPALISADSMAWSFRGRHVHHPLCRMFWDCTRDKVEHRGHCGGFHHNEANCRSFATRWRELLLAPS